MSSSAGWRRTRRAVSVRRRPVSPPTAVEPAASAALVVDGSAGARRRSGASGLVAQMLAVVSGVISNVVFLGVLAVTTSVAAIAPRDLSGWGIALMVPGLTVTLAAMGRWAYLDDRAGEFADPRATKWAWVSVLGLLIFFVGAGFLIAYVVLSGEKIHLQFPR